ncbi:hypothetical protein [Candidatus Hecatella orcuttiae]|uniref:hypothetical protein n=1 Tax=Candidatus Hecatella orcuttiae TaxID=1935119 RepID=UPI00286838A8|nr:hypothetical protein [Candidatus Hecatella orcuttiae]
MRATRISEIIRIDNRGRVIIPASIREAFGLREEAYVMLMADLESQEVKFIPFADPDAKLFEVKLSLTDVRGALAKAAMKMAELGVDLLSTQSRTLQRGKSAEWHAIVDLSKCKLTLGELKRKLVEEGAAKHVEIKQFG